ncbi:putative electron transfer flavoprotein FixA [Desulfobotulus sp. H1]|uniref:Electron transfer flavoprotein FixA n=1 Tax=Desulfobotulus pelophilus TaxID=2823377 RepID=A0ABT3NAT4_9BACT|nr:putative electron transfer flavoprotein FixA [Desulfobotulus pelophilus]MCW7754574.1 putative electron transfer flavoprotein FixA [Desulfobotulus pelophilus]
MKIVVACKLVPEEQDIRIEADGSLEMGKASYKISPFDLNAMEAAVQLRNHAKEGTVTALSIGGRELENTKARKDILSRGADDLILVMDDDFSGILPHKTAEIMAASVRGMGFDLLICGDGSGDLYAQQVAMRTGGLLGVAAVSGVSRILGMEAGTLRVERVLESVVEVLEIPLPAVISVSTDINVPAIPGMKAILSAAKKPVTVMAAEDLGPLSSSVLVDMVEVKAPRQKERKKLIVEGDSEEKISEFINHLRKVLN